MSFQIVIASYSSGRQSERARKNADTELYEVSGRVSELTVTVTSLTNDKRRMEADISAMQADLDEALNGRRSADERADRLQAEVSRLTEELRLEADNYKNADSLRKQLEVEIREITVRLEEAEAFAMKEGKRMVGKLQARVSGEHSPWSIYEPFFLSSYTVCALFVEYIHRCGSALRLPCLCHAAPPTAVGCAHNSPIANATVILKSGLVRYRLHLYSQCGVFYFPWHGHRVEGTYDF